jgi:hypothetical protein
MSEAVEFAAVKMAVGQTRKVIVTVQGGALDTIWLNADHDTVVMPAQADGRPLPWPQSVPLEAGVGSYYVVGVNPGLVQHSFYTGSDAGGSVPSFASVEFAVEGIVEDIPVVEEDPLHDPISIAEPILITIVAPLPA